MGKDRTTRSLAGERMFEDATRLVRELLPTPTVVLAPHPDDETLGCGGLLALHPRPEGVTVVFATDGERSHAGVPGAPPPPALARARREEAVAALGVLGVPRTNARFLGLPDGGLRRRPDALEARLAPALQEARPRSVLLPFRKDRHPDHVALTRGALGWLRRHGPEAALAEYFIYPIWELFGHLDIRSRVVPGHLVSLALGRALDVKRRALERYASQLSAGGPGTPVLPPDSLRPLLSDRERFLYTASPPLRPQALRWSLPLELYHRLEGRTRRLRELKRALLNRLGG